MVSSPGPPPDYTRSSSPAHSDLNEDTGTQLLISPRPGAIDFQDGYLGADGERAAIEGEVQIKAADPAQWSKAVIRLRAVEQAPNFTVELYASEITLFDVGTNPSSSSFAFALPSSIPFAIPLMPDTPQSVRTPFSSLAHTLTVTLHPADPTAQPLIESLDVSPRRYTSHNLGIPTSPETFTAAEPTEVQVQVPRVTFKIGEIIPVYVTIPPPPSELVVEAGLQLRNVRVELVRSIRVKGENGDTPEEMKSKKATFTEDDIEDEDPAMTYKTIVSRSGASCRFHISQPIRLRLLLHPPDSSSPQMHPLLPSASTSNLPQPHNNTYSITQSTILHSVSFYLQVNVGFLSPAYTKSIRIPLTILPPSAPLPEVEPDLDAAYRKKHDHPPTATVRREDTEVHPDGAEAGPSGAAPPPFSEQDEPPPFSAMPGPSFVQLPSFNESSTDDIVVPQSPDALGVDTPHEPPGFPGEGTLFGFPASAHFDGHAREPGPRGSSLPLPPPTMHEALQDTDVSALAPLRGVLEPIGGDASVHGLPPPPPPAMDDPSDPPPSIDSEFRTRNDAMGPPPNIDTAFHTHGQLLPPPGLGEVRAPGLASPPTLAPSEDLYTMPPPETGESYQAPPRHEYAAPHSAADAFDPPPAHQFGPTTTAGRDASSEVAPGSHAPPPYRVPEEGDSGHVARPPPYAG